ncbi:DNA replication factor Cdt1 isoform X2 [Sitophilus oryzae]|uniref:DNA replication factor Cdt1 isoform X2 n=1 Tax=Sitophilus oryzae TaxID=7048 RepID=A0A6J2Y9U7_SITOR|nr:DNA replication factor Cdt1 isoform X2 [Sitophilus oryzae]
MAQPSVACYFNNRKRIAAEDIKISQDQPSLYNGESSEKIQKLQEEKIGESKIVKISSSVSKVTLKKIVRSKTRKLKSSTNNTNIQELFNKMNKATTVLSEEQSELISAQEKTPECKLHVTPPSTPTKINAMDKVIRDGPSLKEIKNKMTRSARLSELKASLNRFQDKEKQLKEIEKKTSQIPESPKLKGFRTIELEVQTSPQKVFSPEQAYLSPKKDGSSVRKNLLNLLTPTKNALALPLLSVSKELFAETSKPGLTLPYKYRFLAEIFRAIDTVAQILFNRKEVITFRKLKPAVEEMLKRNFMEKHLAQIKTVYPDSFVFSQEQLKLFGMGMRAEQWELVIKPNIGDNDSMTAEHMLERKRKLYNILLDKVKDYHQEFLMTLDVPLQIPKDKVTRWHPEFDIEKVPDFELSSIPQAPCEDKITTGKDVLERARVLFNCNTRMETALQKLKEAKQTQTPVPAADTCKAMPQSLLKGIPPALLEKVRQKQAAKALLSMTRSADKEKEVQIYSRLPELARLTRNLFVSEKKSVLLLETVVDKLGNCYRGNLTKTEMEDHLKVIATEVPSWMVFHNIRNKVYVKINKNADLSLVVNKLDMLCKQKNET